MEKWLTTKNIFKIHPLFYVIAFICFITGFLKNFIIFTSIIIIHELGHTIAAIILKWKIDKMIILPFGGITIFKEHIDKPLIEEFLIAIAGPIAQLIYFWIFKENIQFTNYNIAILLFNLLPIYPLDGSRIINIIFNKFISFKFSHILSIILSYISVIVILIFCIKDFNILFLFIILFIVLEIFKETTKHKYYFNKFLLERYLYNYNFKKIKNINKLTQMKKQTKHLFKIDNVYCTEREIIRKTFDK